MKYKTLTSLVICLLLACSIFGQQGPYKLDIKKDGVLFGIGMTAQLTSLYFAGKLNPIGIDELNQLNPNEVNRFDRRTINLYSLRNQLYSDVLLTSAYFYPALFLIDDKSRKGFLEIGVLSTEVFLLNASLTSIAKLSAKRYRPLAYNLDVPIEKRMSKSARLSFFSGHTSAVSVLSFFSAKVFHDYYPESKWRPAVWTTAALIPAATGYFRVKGGKHFPTDVIVGYLVGAAIGVGVPHLHKKKNKDQKIGFKVHAGVNSFGVVMNWK